MQGYLNGAVFTKILPATNCKGTRVKAKCSLGEITLGFSYTGNAKNEQLRAVRALLLKLKSGSIGSYEGTYAIHSAETREGYVHVIEFVGE